ncbi:transposase [Mesorhizobium sp. B2-5-9]|nr:transposase [Mesorhizobium sp. B2-7-2]TPJ95202.1 transposase [Mesorhizobium sp. B2-5-9]
MAISIRRAVSPRLFWRPAAGPTAGAKCSSWPISKRRRARRRAARSPTWSIRSRLSRERIDALFDIERAINGLSPGQRHAVRQERSAPLVTELERWMIETRDKLSRGHDLTKAFNYMLRR